MTCVLLLENRHPTGTSFTTDLKRRYQVINAHSGKQAVELAHAHHPDILILDSVSLRTSGDRLCAQLKEGYHAPLIHVRPEPLEGGVLSPADVVLTPPLTYRKLINRIEQFLTVREGEEVQAGPFRLNLTAAILTTPTGEKKLTPKQARLTELFLRQPGVVIARQTLMREVWQTEYVGDTRTLDVHIRWIRQALERDPDKPQYLKTVRGQGYRLHLPD